jgi:hypothetical protein
MSYLGNTPTQQGFIPAIDFFSGNGSTTAFTLSRPVASVAQVQATIENVPQNPGTAFTVSGNTITFDGAPPSGTNNIYVYYTSPITTVVQPGQGTVGITQLQNGGLPPAAVSDQANTSTGYFDLSSGTTAQRPGSPNTANMRYNTSFGVMEYYNGSAWQAMDVYGANTYPVKYTIVGGGGGGGKGSTTYPAGGAGAGGVLQGIFFATVGVVYTTTIGGGGTGSTSNIGYAGNGSTSSISGSGLTTLEAFGGGRGSNTNATGDVWGVAASSPGCGGGGGTGSSWSLITGFAFFGGPGTSGQGNAGGSGMVFDTTFNSGGGGGGAGRPGTMAVTGNGPVGAPASGGSGAASIINGTVYGGGGGGGYSAYLSTNMNNGGSGGGGQGGNAGTNAVAGTANTGGGGGGGGIGSYQNGASGGSGRVIVSMPSARYTGTTTGSPTVSTSGSDTILDFTSSGTFTA